MGSLLAGLAPFAVGLAVTPTAVVTAILFLSSGRPVANTVAFAVPFALVYLVVAGAVIVASGASSEPLVSDHGKDLAALAVGLFLVALGVLGIVRHRRAAGRAAGQPARRSGLVARVEAAHPPAAFGLGLTLAVLNPNVPILLAGLAAVAAADVSEAGRAVGALFLVGASEVGIAGPLLWYLADRDRATRGLKWLKHWLGRHEHPVDTAVLLGFGTIFTLKGVAGL